MKSRILRLTVVVIVVAAGSLAVLIYSNRPQSDEAEMMECIYEDVQEGQMLRAEQDAIRLIHHMITTEAREDDLNDEQVNLIAERLTDVAREIRFHNTDPGYYEESFCEVLKYMALLELENALFLEKQGDQKNVKVALMQSRERLNEAYQYMTPEAKETTRRLMNDLRKASRDDLNSKDLTDFRDQISQLE